MRNILVFWVKLVEVEFLKFFVMLFILFRSIDLSRYVLFEFVELKIVLER